MSHITAHLRTLSLEFTMYVEMCQAQGVTEGMTLSSRGFASRPTDTALDLGAT